LFKTFAPDYAYFLAADPVVKVLRMMALSDLNLYALANERSVATLLTGATGQDLDGVGQFYSIPRMTVQAANPDAVPPIPEI
jgi:phage-related baseplate assembly protein